MRRRVHIVSDGTIVGTTVYNEDGTPIPGVRAFTIEGDASWDAVDLVTEVKSDKHDSPQPEGR